MVRVRSEHLRGTALAKAPDHSESRRSAPDRCHPNRDPKADGAEGTGSAWSAQPHLAATVGAGGSLGEATARRFGAPGPASAAERPAERRRNPAGERAADIRSYDRRHDRGAVDVADSVPPIGLRAQSTARVGAVATATQRTNDAFTAGRPVSTTQALPEAGVTVSAEARAAKLYEEHRETILRLCMRQLGRHEDAADALQTTFVYALRSLHRGVVPQFELAWLWKIATNVCSTQRRSSAQRAHQDIDALQDVLSAPDRSPHPIAADDLQAALRSLTPNQRQAILLREWKGLSYDEIGDELGISQAATETLLYRARRTLARKLEAAYAVDGLSLASLARSLLTSGAAKATGAAIGTAATIAATSLAIHDLNRPAHHARQPAAAHRSPMAHVAQRVRTFGPVAAPLRRRRSPARPPTTQAATTPSTSTPQHATEATAAAPMPPTAQSPPPQSAAGLPTTVTLPPVVPPATPLPIPALPELPDVVTTPSLPQVSAPKLQP
jgi:RNA polymerase sigma-70 factor (ECF subfamily)